MTRNWGLYFTTLPFYFALVLTAGGTGEPAQVQLPWGVKAVWSMDRAYRETTPTRERICVNGLWQWQPAGESADAVPNTGWGYLKVPAPWPGITGDYMWRDTQTVYPHPAWEKTNWSRVNTAWYQREITVPEAWAGRRVALSIEYLNSYAEVYLDGGKMGEVRFPGGEVDLTPGCRPGTKQVLSLFTAAMPLNAVIQSFRDTNAVKYEEGRVSRRGLCGDVFLTSTPVDSRITDVKVETSTRKGEITVEAGVQGLMADTQYALRARILDGGQAVKEIASRPFAAGDLKGGRFAFTDPWMPEKLWDLHTPQNMYEIQVSLLDSGGAVLDIFQPARFGFREFWIDGRDFILNGSRIFCFAVPFDNAQVSAAAASYPEARETLLRLKAIGVNAVYTHNYSCEPGSHLGFGEILKAADDVGMLAFFSQPHFSHYDWKAPGADQANGYARHAEFYVRQAQNHPSVVMYAMSHNSTGYEEDMNPDLIDGVHAVRNEWSERNAKLALRAEAIVKQLDGSRIVYHHAGGNLSVMHTSNFYLNFTPIQERSDWFEHWATEGIKPLFLCEYGEPWGIDWTLYRGWYQGKRDFGGAKLPWQFCAAEWNSQFLGDRAFHLNEGDKENLRFESKQALAGKSWYRWDYPYPVIGSYSTGSDDKEEVWALYVAHNWRAFRTWGVTAFNAWSYRNFWKLRDGVDKSRKNYAVDWEGLQKPGFSPDYIERRFECLETAYERSDWIPTVAAEALIRNNQPLLAYIAGRPEHFTSQEHNFHPGQVIEKQIIVINNSRETVMCDCAWVLDISQPITGSTKIQVETGRLARVPLRLSLPDSTDPGEYKLEMTARFGNGPEQNDSFLIHVLPKVSEPRIATKIALFDPPGETAELLRGLNVAVEPIDADADLSGYDILIVGKKALTLEGPAPDIGRVRNGLKVLLFEQTAEVLEKRLGFRVQEYGLRNVFPRVSDHPVLHGLAPENLHDWRGQATLIPSRLEYELRPQHGPVIRWCGIEVSRPWRCGCWGNVASVLIEKPALGDFLPIVDGGFSLQYSPLMEYREGKGMTLFCQMDVTGRTDGDPAAKRLAANMLQYMAEYQPPGRRQPVYAGDPVGRSYFEKAGLPMAEYAGGELTPGQVLIVTPGGSEKLSSHKESILAWLKAGGHVLAIGLDEREAKAFLPFGVTMENQEYINAVFDPLPLASPLAGIGPADVLIREPRELPLVAGGATIVGGGVLAAAPDTNVVFCQLAPWHFDYEKIYNRKITFRRTSSLVTRLLANAGVSTGTPLLARFPAPVEAGPDHQDAEKSVDDSPRQGRWLTGLYLDQPEEMDDPYRFFRW